jgi:hypothetical protein
MHDVQEQRRSRKYIMAWIKDWLEAALWRIQEHKQIAG